MDLSTGALSKQPLEFFSNDEIYVGDIKIKGKIKIISSSRITISPKAQLEGVLIQAPEVVIENNVKGEFQVFASNIVVGENVDLAHPSVLLVHSDSKETSPELMIKEGSTINGLVICESDDNAPAQLLIDGSELNGFVYNEGVTQIKGEVNGALYSSEFILKTPSAVYKNHLLNVKILVSENIKGLSFPNILEEQDLNSIVKWLN